MIENQWNTMRNACFEALPGKTWGKLMYITSRGFAFQMLKIFESWHSIKKTHIWGRVSASSPVDGRRSSPLRGEFPSVPPRWIASPAFDRRPKAGLHYIGRPSAGDARSTLGKQKKRTPRSGENQRKNAAKRRKIVYRLRANSRWRAPKTGFLNFMRTFKDFEPFGKHTTLTYPTKSCGLWINFLLKTCLLRFQLMKNDCIPSRKLK